MEEVRRIMGRAKTGQVAVTGKQGTLVVPEMKGLRPLTRSSLNWGKVNCEFRSGLLFRSAEIVKQAVNNKLTDARYFGKICEKHPELNGLRRRRNHDCVQCARNYLGVWRLLNQEYVAAVRAEWYINSGWCQNNKEEYQNNKEEIL